MRGITVGSMSLYTRWSHIMMRSISRHRSKSHHSSGSNSRGTQHSWRRPSHFGSRSLMAMPSLRSANMRRSRGRSEKERLQKGKRNKRERLQCKLRSRRIWKSAGYGSQRKLKEGLTRTLFNSSSNYLKMFSMKSWFNNSSISRWEGQETLQWR